MRLHANSDDLSKAAQWAAKHAMARPHYAALSGALLTAEGDRLGITCTTLETTATAVVEAAVETDGEALVPADRLARILARCDGKTTLDLAEDRLKVSGGPRFTLRTMPADDWPTVAETSGDGVECEGLAEAVAAVLPAVGDANDRAILAGVHLKATGGRLCVEATNGHVLLRAVLDWPGEDCDMILPRSAASELANMDAPTLTPEQSQATLTTEGRRVVARFIEARFPDAGQLIPDADSHPNRAGVEVERLRHALADVAAIVEQGRVVSPVRLSFSEGQVEVDGGTGEVGEGSAEVACDYQGEPLTIGFNWRYLSDVLASMGSESAWIGLRDELKPALIRPHDGPDRLGLVMPVKL